MSTGVASNDNKGKCWCGTGKVSVAPATPAIPHYPPILPILLLLSLCSFVLIQKAMPDFVQVSLWYYQVSSSKRHTALHEDGGNRRAHWLAQFYHYFFTVIKECLFSSRRQIYSCWLHLALFSALQLPCIGKRGGVRIAAACRLSLRPHPGYSPFLVHCSP